MLPCPFRTVAACFRPYGTSGCSAKFSDTDRRARFNNYLAAFIKEAIVSKVKSPYKKSIWDQDLRYAVADVKIGKRERQVIARLMSVDAAKKNTPPIPIQGLLTISVLARAMPKAALATRTNVESYIANASAVHGAGIPTVICMLAVESNGDYPPMDEKFSAGLNKKGIISDSESRSLNGSSQKRFAKIYVEKVIPAWMDSLKDRTAQEADNYWGRGGNDG